MTYPFLVINNFNPEEITELTVAYENTCAAVPGAYKSDKIKERIAARVISIAIGGERDATNIYMQCLKELMPFPQIAETQPFGLNRGSDSRLVGTPAPFLR